MAVAALARSAARIRPVLHLRALRKAAPSAGQYHLRLSASGVHNLVFFVVAGLYCVAARPEKREGDVWVR